MRPAASELHDEVAEIRPDVDVVASRALDDGREDLDVTTDELVGGGDENRSCCGGGVDCSAQRSR